MAVEVICYPTTRNDIVPINSFDREYIPGTNPPRKYERGRHAGIDLGGGGALLAVCAGTISRRSFGPAFGNQLTVVRPDGQGAFYAHLASVAVDEGQHVEPGDFLGIMGETGQVSGVHLHFEWRTDWDNWATAINPYTALEAARVLTAADKQFIRDEIRNEVRTAVEAVLLGAANGTYATVAWKARIGPNSLESVKARQEAAAAVAGTGGSGGTGASADEVADELARRLTG